MYFIYVLICRSDNYGLFEILHPPAKDFKFFVRPFTNLTWLCLLLTIAIPIIAISCLNKFPFFHQKNAMKIISICCWIAFGIIYAYYGGALTMFFITEEIIPFNSLKEALSASPEWKIISIHGSEGVFKYPAERVCS